MVVRPIIIMRRFRGFRGIPRRGGMRPMIKTYKKVLNFAEASFAPGNRAEQIAIGVDGVAVRQLNATDGAVPTGSRLKFFEVQFVVANLQAQPIFVNCSLQYLLANQNHVDPDLVGGNPQRNQVLHQDLYSVGEGQNSTHKFKFKIPSKFQRIREGMSWELVWSNNNTVTKEHQIIYKVEQ